MDCNDRVYQNNGRRLAAKWRTASEDLEDFWTQVENKEPPKDQVQVAAALLKKRALRSVQEHTLKAFDAVDNILRSGIIAHISYKKQSVWSHWNQLNDFSYAMGTITPFDISLLNNEVCQYLSHKDLASRVQDSATWRGWFTPKRWRELDFPKEHPTVYWNSRNSPELCVT
ncbi:MAG: hypothetical protein J3Q66DRAFT_393553 [Benniella sp.]|nr:MAG: hypothetical protein J3Q66DRAFT_393553 [Benniella sp.]